MSEKTEKHFLVVVFHTCKQHQAAICPPPEASRLAVSQLSVVEVLKAASALVIRCISEASSFFEDGEDWQRLHMMDACLLLAGLESSTLVEITVSIISLLSGGLVCCRTPLLPLTVNFSSCRWRC